MSVTKNDFRKRLQKLAREIYDETRVTSTISMDRNNPASYLPYIWHYKLKANDIVVPMSFNSKSLEAYTDEALSSLLKQSILDCEVYL